jgi:hypothetical protein
MAALSIQGLRSAAVRCLLLACSSILLFGCSGPRNDRVAYRERYDKQLVSSGTYFASLPLAVQNTVRAQTGSAGLADVTKYTTEGRIVYEVVFQNQDLYPPLYIASDGSLLDPNLAVAIGAPHDQPNVLTGGPVSGITLNDLPPAVVKSLQRRAPDAQLDSITKEGAGDKTIYVITFKDQVHPALHLALDGMIVDEPAR